MERYLRGSNWARWDLHIHTPYSVLNNGFGKHDDEETWDNYIYNLVTKARAKNIVAVGITDYYSIDGYIKVREILNNRDRMEKIFNGDRMIDYLKYAEKMLFLPNIELRLQEIIGKGSYVDYHIIFSDKLDPNYIKSNFIESLEFEISGSKSGINKKRLTKDNIKDVGQTLIYEEGFPDNPYKIGLEHISVDLEEIINTLEKDDSLNYSHLRVVATDESLSQISWKGRGSLTRKKILKNSHMFFASNPNTVQWALGKKCQNIKEHIEEFGNIKPCIHGSDAHSNEKLFECSENRFCWIKALPTFEGLMQIVSEPESRIRIQSTEPGVKDSFKVIDYIEILDNNFEEEKIYLNNNLTCIIGGRSTGKSLLLNNIVYKLNRKQLEKKFTQANPTKKDIKGNMYLVDNINIYWKDGSINNEDSNKKIIYIPQNYLNSLAESKEQDTEIDEIIKDIVFQNEDISKKDEDRKKLKGLEKNIIDKNIIDLISLHDEKKSLNDELIENGSIEDIRNEINTNKINLRKLTKEDTDEDIIESIEKYREEVKKLNEKIITLNEDKDKIKDINLLKIDRNIFHTLKNDKVRNDINLTITDYETNLNKNWFDYKEIINKFIEESIEELSKINLSKTNELNKLEDKMNKTIEIEKISKKINELSDKLEQSKQLNKKIEDIKLRIEDITDQLINSINRYKLIVDEYICYVNNYSFKNNQDKFQDLTFSLERALKKETFTNMLNSLFDKRSLNKFSISKDEHETYEYNEEVIKLLIKDILKEDILKLKNNNSKEMALKQILGDYYNINYLVKMEEDLIEHMSPGKKSLALLRLLIDLSNSSWPILIDQPEDDLDNRSIYKDLVSYIKDKKEERQIIIATHNANIVIGADSEQIIISNQHGDDTPNNNNKQFEYRSDPIECDIFYENEESILYREGIKYQVCRVLEGGERAFELRNKKYFMK